MLVARSHGLCEGQDGPQLGIASATEPCLSLQGSRVWDPGQKLGSLLEGLWIQHLQLSFPPLAAVIDDELLAMLMIIKELYLERPAAAGASNAPGRPSPALKRDFKATLFCIRD